MKKLLLFCALSGAIMGTAQAASGKAARRDRSARVVAQSSTPAVGRAAEGIDPFDCVQTASQLFSQYIVQSIDMEKSLSAAEKEKFKKALEGIRIRWMLMGRKEEFLMRALGR